MVQYRDAGLHFLFQRQLLCFGLDVGQSHCRNGGQCFRGIRFGLFPLQFFRVMDDLLHLGFRQRFFVVPQFGFGLLIFFLRQTWFGLCDHHAAVSVVQYVFFDQLFKKRFSEGFSDLCQSIFKIQMHGGIFPVEPAVHTADAIDQALGTAAEICFPKFEFPEIDGCFHQTLVNAL